MKVYKIKPCSFCNPYIEKDLKTAIQGIQAFLSESNHGTVLTVRVLEMSEKQFEELPEYMGP